MKRRFLLKTGAGMITVLAGTGALWGSTREPLKAKAPWKNAGTGFGDPRLDCLSYAILAPSPHNRQPWQVKLVGKQDIQLYCDLERRLPHTDPFDRQITIGLGCFLELLKMTAAEMGYQADITSFPLGEPSEFERLDKRPIANIRLTEAKTKPDPLFQEVLNRRSTKEAFSTDRKITQETLNSLLTVDATYGSVDGDRLQTMKHILYEGMTVEFKTKHTLKESADLMRFGKKQIEESPDGIDIGGPLLELLAVGGLLTRENFSDPEHSVVTDHLARVKNIYETSQAVVWQTSADNSRLSQLEAGANYLRLNLKATQLGLAIQPISQTLQEYSEMAPLYKKVHSELDISSPERLQMIARVGYSGVQNPSPRWPLKSILKAQHG